VRGKVKSYWVAYMSLALKVPGGLSLMELVTQRKQPRWPALIAEASISIAGSALQGRGRWDRPCQGNLRC